MYNSPALEPVCSTRYILCFPKYASLDLLNRIRTNRPCYVYGRTFIYKVHISKMGNFANILSSIILNLLIFLNWVEQSLFWFHIKYD